MYLEGDAAGMVLRLALKTRFCESGWGSTPPPSARISSILTLHDVGLFEKKLDVVRQGATIEDVVVVDL